MKRFKVAFCVAVLIGAVSHAKAQEYKNSVASVDFDYIHENDPSAFEELVFVEKRDSEMPDKRPGKNQLIHPAFVFDSSYSDGTRVRIFLDVAFKTKEAAEKEAKRYVPRLGKLPTSLRSGVNRLIVHRGGKDTTAFSDVGLIVVYSENATKRISTNDLEETIFHESVHASWDKKHATSEGWRRAQAQDAAFVTTYAKRNPKGEDLAESALFAYALLHHPGRIPTADAKKIKKAIPARIRFVADLLPPGKPIFYPVEKQKADSSTSETKSVDQQAETQSVKRVEKFCKIDIQSTGQLKDILSNALMLGLDKKEKKVSEFLNSAVNKSASSSELFQMTLDEFKLERSVLASKLSECLHCNCDHVKDEDADQKLEAILARWAEDASKTNSDQTSDK